MRRTFAALLGLLLVGCSTADPSAADANVEAASAEAASDPQDASVSQDAAAEDVGGDTPVDADPFDTRLCRQTNLSFDRASCGGDFFLFCVDIDEVESNTVIQELFPGAEYEPGPRPGLHLFSPPCSSDEYEYITPRCFDHSGGGCTEECWANLQRIAALPGVGCIYQAIFM